jgi:hypothetical protein
MKILEDKMKVHLKKEVKIVGSNHNTLKEGPIKLIFILNQGVLQHVSIMKVRKIVNMEQ